MNQFHKIAAPCFLIVGSITWMGLWHILTNLAIRLDLSQPAAAALYAFMSAIAIFISCEVLGKS